MQTKLKHAIYHAKSYNIDSHSLQYYKQHEFIKNKR
jgi:hypothetical protein